MIHVRFALRNLCLKDSEEMSMSSSFFPKSGSMRSFGGSCGPMASLVFGGRCHKYRTPIFLHNHSTNWCTVTRWCHSSACTRNLDCTTRAFHIEDTSQGEGKPATHPNEQQHEKGDRKRHLVAERIVVVARQQLKPKHEHQAAVGSDADDKVILRGKTHEIYHPEVLAKRFILFRL